MSLVPAVAEQKKACPMKWLQNSENMLNHDLITIFYAETTGENLPGSSQIVNPSAHTHMLIHKTAMEQNCAGQWVSGTLHPYPFSHFSPKMSPS